MLPADQLSAYLLLVSSCISTPLRRSIRMSVLRGASQKGQIHSFALAPTMQRVHHPPQRTRQTRNRSDMHWSKGKRQVKTPLEQFSGLNLPSAAAAATRPTPESVGSVVGSVRCKHWHVNAPALSKEYALPQTTRHDASERSEYYWSIKNHLPQRADITTCHSSTTDSHNN
ncbi:hypothetical protein TraAM80_01494 [Trypanosoma rangeli]|uniref:Uncharacterized protein n=1 Tax=Trypanosoma rangeli TaxID=5698 RepID=A0A3S5ISC0_TRYRA|nr:uncharacterized protein TraAM80_01494 [Trypanosoma rangeli]RNF10567.1 hypothetical protein TraAM80_01494 [Trypanosoma rangeli]|eukprot:RNF10567.1 hypothetical protein TraAM80_01494 [Trypanosoma rangeli]